MDGIFYDTCRKRRGWSGFGIRRYFCVVKNPVHFWIVFLLNKSVLYSNWQYNSPAFSEMYSDKSNLEIGRLTSAGCSSSPAALSFCCSIFCSANAFALQNMEQQKLRAAGLELQPADVSLPISKFDLSLYISENAGELYCQFEYSTDLFKRKTIQKWTGFFTTQKYRLIPNPDQPRRFRQVS